MRHLKALSLMIVILIPSLVCAQEEQNFRMYWDNGFKLRSEDGAYKLKFGGRIMYDYMFMDQDQVLSDTFGDFSSGNEFRRVRLFNSGTIYNSMYYILDIAFEGQEVEFKDIFIEFRDVPSVGNIRVGRFKEANVLEELTSSKYITFMERSFVSDINPTRNYGGIMFHRDYYDGRLAWQAQLTHGTDSEGETVDLGDNYIVMGRIAGLPIYNEEKERALHLGGYYRYEKPNNGEVPVKIKPSTHLGPSNVSNTISGVESGTTVGGEFSVALGALNIQAEYAVENLDHATNTSIEAYYGQVSYFLTGESQGYKDLWKAFDRIRPRKNFGQDGGIGAFQLAVRYGAFNFSNNLNVPDENLTTITAGVNWHWNPAARFMFNYVLADLQGVGNANIFQMRFQVDF